ncbi:UDP-galactopyranose mutase [Candidatus Cyanaurora vandensis]|uniref:UDP-galactopyranose mutase n=1 Tax=Candidatus Cyanaurora vandensis TaxID=2714958 RepID=UPI002580A496|nr:UDP-galactopyranose mutase [Candidatus Cyanaurora vandensis]
MHNTENGYSRLVKEPTPGVAAPDLVCFSHLRWNFVYQRPQHLLSRGAQDRRVFFIEEPRTAETVGLDVTQTEPGVWVVVPLLPDGTGEETQQTLLAQLFADFAVEQYICWYYTPMAMGFTRHLTPLLTIYDCMDELSAFKNAPTRLKEREAELFERADLVFTGGQSLYEAKRGQHPNVYSFPSSVDLAHFTPARQAQAEPADQAVIPHPRLGFYGVIDERMDLELIQGLALARPDWHLVLVGPIVKINPAHLPTQPNIHYLGSKSYSELPQYLAGWDVALMPFALNESTRFISPTKTPEYLAAGKPVVSTPINDVVRPYGEKGLVQIAQDVPEFVAQVTQCLAGMDSDWLPQVDNLLQRTSWDHTWTRMKQLIDSALDTTGTTVPLPSFTVRENGFDYLIVGAGFAGSVLAERLARDSNKRVLLVDRRAHIAGNAYDHYNDAGVLIHRYGPHIFHTNAKEVFEYLSNFTSWRPYQHRVRASVDGQLLPIPINLDTINQLYGLNLSTFQVEEFFRSVAEPRSPLKTSEDVVVNKVGRELYEKFFRNYTRKQWGLDPSELHASVTARVPTRTNRDDRYFTDSYQAMPLYGYTRMFENMLSHPNISVMLNTDYRAVQQFIPFKHMVYTGPVDEYFDYCYGKLPYRSLEFKHETLDQPVFQTAPVVNYPNDYLYTRITEFKYLTGQQHPKTSIVYEIPQAEGDPYYPIPRTENAELYKRYQNLVEETPNVQFVGRLATYKYYNMDQVVAQALTIYNKIAVAK